MRGKRLSAIMGGVLLTIGALAPAWADGTETLGAPLGLTLADGDTIVADGVGTFQANGATLEITLPSGTINQVIAYWAGEEFGNVLGDDTITLDGTPVTGTDIGGPAFFFTFGGNDVYYSAFRKDVTDDVTLIPGGVNFVEVGDMDFAASNSGVGLVVVMDTGVESVDLSLRDGVDIAFGLFPEPRKSMVPQTFMIPAATVPRTVQVSLIAGSVGVDRPNSLDIVVDGVMDSIPNPFNSNDGELWDTFDLMIDVPANEGAGSSSITILPVSRDDLGTGDLVASLVWIGATAAVPPVCGDGELDPGEECDDGNTDNLDACRNDCTLPFCGDGILDPGEECDDGNNDPGDECSPECDVEEEENTGCTPGYWRNHRDNWGPTMLRPADSFNATFGVDFFDDAFPLGGPRRVGAIWARGGGLGKVARHGTAALLNARHPAINYPLTADEVIAFVQSGNVDALVPFNELSDECPAQGFLPALVDELSLSTSSTGPTAFDRSR